MPRNTTGIATNANDAGARPFRLGVWCDYSTLTLGPSLEGIGVFVANLLEGLLAGQDESLEICVLVRPGEQDRFAEIVARYPGRVEVIPAPNAGDRKRAKARWNVVGRARAWARRVLDTRVQKKADAASRRARRLDVASEIVRTAAQVAACDGTVGRPWLLLARCYARGAATWAHVDHRFRLTRIGFRAQLARIVDQLTASTPIGDLRLEPTPNQIALAANCDLWVAPHGVLPTTLKVPYVVFVHDVVTEHFQECFDPFVVERVRQLIQGHAEEAIFVCCMSEFIRKHDLIDLLGVPAERTRMVPVAGPRPFDSLTNQRADTLVAAILPKRRFLFWPAAFRGYKGHCELLSAVAIVRDKYGLDDFDVVFSGHSHGREIIEQTAARLGLTMRVYYPGFVTREQLGAIYKRATATIVPTQYEQASFPVFEALSARCAVACADIPPLREQCVTMGDAMVYVNPVDPASIADGIVKVLADPAGLAERQWNASHALRERNWNDSAVRWLQHFKEAADIARHRRAGERGSLSRTRRQVMFLQSANGNVANWQATAEVLKALGLLNRQRRLLEMVIGVHPDAEVTERTIGLPELCIVRISPIRLPAGALQANLGEEAKVELTGDQETLFFNGSNGYLLESDAWVLLDGEMSGRIAPLRPYGVLDLERNLGELGHAETDSQFVAGLQNGQVTLAGHGAGKQDLIAALYDAIVAMAFGAASNTAEQPRRRDAA
jgi:glycosyltransferase involved in cell wall biosynthesis